MNKEFVGKIAKKTFSFFCIVLILKGILFVEVFAGLQLDNQLFQIRVNDSTSYASDIEVQPGDKISLLLSGQNLGDSITNPYYDLSFSSTDFSYDPTGLSTYNGSVVYSNIPLASFNPGVVNTLSIDTSADTGDYLFAYYVNLTLDSDSSETQLVISSTLKSDLGASSAITRNVFINSRPHIIDYYFSKSGSQVSQLTRGGGDSVDLFVKVKDYNSCSDLDGATVTADLSSLGLTANETLTYDSCSSNEALFKKSSITTIVLPGTLSFSNSNFSVTDEGGNSNLPSDPNTSFDDENKTTTINLEIVSDGTPEVELTTNDSYIGGTTNLNTDLVFSGNQNGQYKIVIGDDGVCDTGTILVDWTGPLSYTAGTETTYTLQSSSLSEGDNSIYVCFKNDLDDVGSSNLNIVLDTSSPSISTVSASPGNVIDEDSILKFTCSENGEYRIEKGGDGTIASGTLMGTGSVVATTLNQYTLDNAQIDLDDNLMYIFCLDNASNYTNSNLTINKTTPPLSFAGETISVSDSDIDYDGLDGRDISITWDNTKGLAYSYFDSYRLYIVPSNVTLDEDNDTYIYVELDVNANSFVGTENITVDSLGDSFVSGASYKACLGIMGTNGVLGTTGCSTASVLTSDSVSHPEVVSAKFISDTNLEITTNATLDTNVSSHSGTLISYDYNSSTFSGVTVTSIDGKKINIEIPSLGDVGATGTDLTIGTGAIRADAGGFNNALTFASITDGQAPSITALTLNTASPYNNFYTGSIEFAYNFDEDMKTAFTKLVFVRTGGNLDATTHEFNITGSSLLSGNNTVSFDTSVLIDGTTYEAKITGEDLAGNYGVSDVVANIKYDSIGPDIVVTTNDSLYSSITPTLTWNIPSDNSSNGSGVKEYNVTVYNGTGCTSGVNQTTTVGTNSATLTALTDVADYSFKVVAVDNMDNIGTESACSDFRVDTSVPSFLNSQIEDLTISSTTYIKKGNNIKISADIADTDIDHVWLDLSSISLDVAHDDVACAAPDAGITCTRVGDLVEYSFTAGASITDGTKQVQFRVQNTSGGNEQTKILSITADSTAPVVLGDALTAPTGIVGGTSTDVTWTTSKIYDAIALDYLKVEYSTGAGDWNLVGTGANVGTVTWDLSSLLSSDDYKIKITAYDEAGNSTGTEYGVFEVDRTAPVVPANTITFPNGGEVLGSDGSIDITWDDSLITDSNLNANPISLYYSNDGGTNWVTIVTDQPNNGLFNWTHGNINLDTVIIKLIASDDLGNTNSDISDASFVIDTTTPSFSFDFGTTPINGSYINNTGVDIVGDTSDSYLEEVTYSFQNLDTGEYYNGTVYTGSTVIKNNVCNDPVVSGTNTLCNSLNFTLNILVTDTTNYRLLIYSEDEAGNIKTSIPLDFIGDTVNPVVTISTSNNTYFKDNITITGTSSDAGAGISSVGIQIKDGTDYWDGSSFVGTEQTLLTTTSDDYANWTYLFDYSGADATFEIITVAYDKAYKVNNTSTDTINVIKDTVNPSISGGTSLYTSPVSSDIFIGGNTININWNSVDITDADSGFGATPITLEYFDGSVWNTIACDEANDGAYSWTAPSIDSSNVRIRITATDIVLNTSLQNSDAFVIDSTAPTIDSIETMDMDANGEIDALNVIMSENIKDSTIVLADFNISDAIGIPTSFETGSNPNDDEFVLKFANIGDTSLRPDVSYTKGSLEDIAGKLLESVAGVNSVDKASPRVLNARIQDIDSNGKFDKIIVQFSENMSSSTDTSVFSITNILNGITIDSVSVSGDEASIILGEGSDYDTSVGSMLLNFSSNANWADLFTNQAGSKTNISITDEAEPVVILAEYYDTNSNSKVDSVEITFSEDIVGFNDGDFSINNLTKNVGSVSGDILTYTITETGSDNDTGVVADFSFTTGNLADSSGNFVSDISNYNIEDKVVPKLLSIETDDSDSNGKLDNIILTYSEDLNSDFASFVAEVDSYSVSSYSKDGNDIIEINVSEKQVYDTDATPIVRINSNSSITDNNGNLVEVFSFTASTDKIGPVIIGARYDEALNKIFINSSETLNLATFITTNLLLNNSGLYSITGADSGEKSITLSGETITYGSSEISFVNVEDTLGNIQVVPVYQKISAPIIINEIMVSDDTNNNYIELRNLSSSIVDISDYTIAGVTIPGATNIAGDGYYLISKTNEATSILNVAPDLVDAGLDISGASITLNDSIIDIDYASLTTGFDDTTTPKSIERKDNASDGLLSDSWYTAQTSIGFDTGVPFGTPGIANVFDATAPVIGVFYPTDDLLLSNGNFNVEINYVDTGLGIDTTTDSLTLSKWDGVSWGADIAATYTDFGLKTVTSTVSSYDFSGVTYGKYKLTFNISDLAGNVATKTIIFYVDQITFNLDSSSSNLGSLTADTNIFSNELVITVETVGAGFTIDINKIGNMLSDGDSIGNWDGTNGFGYDLYNAGYSGNLTSMGNSIEIVNEAGSINTDGDKNVYTYKIKLGVNVPIMQSAGNYSVTPWFELTSIY